MARTRGTRAPSATRRGAARRLLVAVSAAAGVAAACRRASGSLGWLAPAGLGRRGALGAAAAAAAAAIQPDAASAFNNAVRKIKRDLNNPKRPGPMPDELGMMERYGYEDGALKGCENLPNCFSTTTLSAVDEGYHAIKPWVFNGKSPEEAMKEIKQVIEAYKPGQQGIDGGGFQLIAEGPDFVYYQFESLKRGYIDDVEFAIKPGWKKEDTKGEVYLRTASRQGYYDYGVNGVRLNTIANALEKNSGWTVDKTSATKHPRYWAPNCDAGLGRKAPFNTYDQWPDYCGSRPVLQPNPNLQDVPGL